MITVFVHYNNIFINKIFCDSYMNEGSVRTLRLIQNDDLITAFPLSRVEKFELIDSGYEEYYLNIIGVDEHHENIINND